MVATLIGALALAAALLLPSAGAEAEEGEFANPGSIEGTVTKTGGAKVKDVEVCAFDVAEDEEFTECAATKSTGTYEIDGLDEGPYRVEFKSGESGLSLETQFWKGAATAAKAVDVRVEEGKTDTGIDAEMKVTPGTALGGTEFGDPCEFTHIVPGAAAFEFEREGSPLHAAAPVAGVLTRWIVKTPAEYPAGLNAVDVRVVDPVGSGIAAITGKSTIESLQPGKNSFETRLPIALGDHLALGSNSSLAPACGDPNIEYPLSGAYFEEPVANPGSKQPYVWSEFGVPVVGVIEPDEDGDGYGDESQDDCPQSAAFHAACPAIALAPGYWVGAKKIEVKVRSSASTPVAITGASPGPGILSATKKVKRGETSSIQVPIPAALAKRVRRLPSTQALHIRLRAHATKVDGVPSTDHLWIRLPGRG